MTTTPFSLYGDVAVITGAGSGIGEGTAHVLANAGARIVCAGRREAAPGRPDKSGRRGGRTARDATTAGRLR